MKILYKRGSKGKEVEKIQRKLKKLGYYLGKIDGDFGGGTESAVKRFQRDNGLKVD
jgi:peptidoglycan hydrolase-like protein with peptidoglycan-binding domain